MDVRRKRILKEYQQRLVEINSRSRAYYLASVSMHAVSDLYEAHNRFGQSGELSEAILAKTPLKFKHIGPDRQAFFHAVETQDDTLLKATIMGLTKTDTERLMREVSQEDRQSIFDKYDKDYFLKFKNFQSLFELSKEKEREQGSPDLYIGYPIIEGRFPSGKAFRAPLCFFQVKASIKDQITLEHTDLVLLNPVFLISYLLEMNQDEEAIDYELLSDNPVAEALEKLTALGLNFTVYEAALSPYKTLKRSEFDGTRQYQVSTYHIYHHAVVGIFPISSKSIYYDLRQMEKSGQTNALLDDFFVKLSKDFKEDYRLKERERTFNESTLAFISPLDITQKRAVAKALKRSLVIEGPPGTGKSQTIANIIANYLMRQKRVLVVSEKRAALDVVYERMDALKPFMLLIHDALSEKQSFYDQLSKAFFWREEHFYHEKSTISSTEENQLIERFFENHETILGLLETKYYGWDLQAWLEIENEKIPCDVPYVNKVLALEDSMDVVLEKLRTIEANELVDQYAALTRHVNAQAIYTRFDYDFDTLVALKNTLATVKRSKRFVSFVQVLYGLNEPLKVSDPSLKALFHDYMKHEHQIDTELIEKGRVPKPLYPYVKLMHDYRLDTKEFLRMYQAIKAKEVMNKHKDVLTFFFDYDKEYQHYLTQNAHKIDVSILHIFNTLLSFQKKHEDVESIQELKRLTSLKKKRSIEHVMKEHASTIKNLFPVFMMNPDTVSNVLPFEPDQFDVVIFDEASQLFIENAIPALYRAKRMIIAGDSEQLKPSSLFHVRYLGQSEEEMDDYGAREIESLLDYTKFKFPSTMLKYHYRSLHKDLIAFSNHAFYQEQLIFATALPEVRLPIERIETQGVWHNGVNEEEAKVVVKTLERLIKEDEQNSYGIITFNNPQRELISRLIEEASVKNPLLMHQRMRENMASGEDKRLFVKNIENVQGDERDVIVFSVGYGKNPEGKVLSLFGSLSQSGGENRLNVAITRAKRKIVLVTSVKSSAFNPDVSSKGARIFMDYLRYIEMTDSQALDAREALLKTYNKTAKKESVSAQIQEELEGIVKHIRRHLNTRRFEIKQNERVGSFVLDMVIIDKLSNQPTLGIFVDFSNTAFEQTLYEQRYLENRGWHVYRLWRVNYWQDKEREVMRIIAHNNQSVKDVTS